jgi:hypothetical protein
MWSETPHATDLVILPSICYVAVSNPLTKRFLSALKFGWLKHMDSLRGGPSPVMHMNSHEDLAAVRRSRLSPGPQ